MIMTLNTKYMMSNIFFLYKICFICLFCLFDEFQDEVHVALHWLTVHCCCTVYITLLYNTTTVFYLSLQNGGQLAALCLLLPKVWLWNISKIITFALFVVFVQNQNIKKWFILLVMILILLPLWSFHIWIRLLHHTFAIWRSRTIQSRQALHHHDMLFLDWLNKIYSSRIDWMLKWEIYCVTNLTIKAFLVNDISFILWFHFRRKSSLDLNLKKKTLWIEKEIGRRI